jgi:hypothetical protein
MSTPEARLNDCGCCEGLESATPQSFENQPGLSILAYRVGTHGSFKKSMLASLASEPKLSQLTTRDDNDPAVALLDAWATTLDLLTFYQERIANEGFLRTATERLSLLELARSIGYELSPGVAASTYLAFTINDRDGAPKTATLPVGVKAQTIPGEGELPQLFETIEEIIGNGDWNELRARTRQLVLPASGDKTIYLKGITTDLKPGDGVLIVGDERLADSGNENWDFRRAVSVTADAAAGFTVVKLNDGLGITQPFVSPAKKNPKVYALRQRANLFGYNAPDWRAMPDSVKAGYLGLPSNSTVSTSIKEWPDFTVASISDPPGSTSPGVGLRGEYFNTKDLSQRVLIRLDPKIDFNWGGSSPDPSIDPDTFSIRWTGWIKPKVTGPHTFSVTTDDGVRVWIDGQLVINAWQDQATTLVSPTTVPLTAGTKVDIKVEYFENLGSAQIRLFWSAPGVPNEIIPTANLYPRDIYSVHLDAAYPRLLPGGWAVLSIPEYQELYETTSAIEDSRTNFTITIKGTKLTLKGENLLTLFNERIRDTMVFAQSELLDMAERPITTPVGGKQITLDRKVDGLLPGRLLAITGKDSATGEARAEIAEVETAVSTSGLTVLDLKTGLQYSYLPDSILINANVARATHGETQIETLGSGNASEALQRFVLKKKPLTYVSASTPSGTASTLEVRVNNILWHEVPTLFNAGPHDRVFVTSQADDGAVTVQFGDGYNGARLPTGIENVSAEYRSGLGLQGLVDAGQISLLMTRPLSVNAVVNPVAPDGAADPETRDEARANATLTVMTLDRIVSLRDFEDFTRAFAGIGKAQAIWLWDGEQRLIHLTIAAGDGSGVVPTSALFMNLVAAIDGARHSQIPVRVDSYDLRQFNVEAKILVDPDFVSDDVLAAVKGAIESAFSFTQRAFGQALTSSEVFAVAQAVLGVLAVDLDALYFTLQPNGQPASPKLDARLPANVARWVVNQIEPAELVTVNPDGIKLTAVFGL